MNSLLIVIPVWPGDVNRVLDNLHAQSQRDAKTKHPVLLVIDQRIATEQYDALRTAAGFCFETVSSLTIVNTKAKEPWPDPQNFVWQTIARHLEVPINGVRGWFLWESDALPLKVGWIDVLADAYVAGNRPLMGNIVPGRGHMNAVAVYPFGINLHCEKAMLVRKSPFDIALTKEIGLKRVTEANHLIVHHLKSRGGDAPKQMTNAIQQSLPATAVIVHGYMASLAPEDPSKREWKPDCSISIVCFNNLELTQRCIESVLKHSNNFELIITDNASTDGTEEYLGLLPSEEKRRIKIVTNRKNLGFNQPNNHAASIAQGLFFVMLNNDVEVCKGWLSSFRSVLKNREVGIVGISGTCSELSDQCTGKPGKLEYVEASCCMMRSELAREFGPFSQYLNFAYHEDSDLSLRLRECGYRIEAIPIPIKHRRAATSSKVEGIQKIEEGNRQIMMNRWGFYLKSRTFDRKILLRRSGAHGDVLFLTPIIRAMLNKWSKCTVTVDTDYPDILTSECDAHRGVDDSKFDTVFDLDLAYEKTPKKHIVDAYYEACGMRPGNRKLDYRTPLPAAHGWAKEQKTLKPLVVMHAGPTGWPGRDWPVERFEELAKKLKMHGWDVATLGDGKNIHINGTRDLRGTQLDRLNALIFCADLFVGIDSFPFNIAQAYGKRAIGLFGTINPAYRICSDNAIAVHATRAQAKCLFAHHDQPPPITKSICSGECMRAITVQSVLEAITK